MTTTTARAIPQFPHLVGFDQLVETLTRPSRQACYPPHNIIKVDEQYAIQLAVAGYVMDELSIDLCHRVLVVTGTPNKDRLSNTEYIYKGLSTKRFAKKFDLADNVKVTGAALANGLLTITLDVVVPEATSSVKIEIEEQQ